MREKLLLSLALLLWGLDAQAQGFGQVAVEVKSAQGPLAGARCLLAGQTAMTGTDGRLLFKRVPEGAQRLVCKMPGFRMQSRALQLKAGETLRLSLLLHTSVEQQKKEMERKRRAREEARVQDRAKRSEEKTRVRERRRALQNSVLRRTILGADAENSPAPSPDPASMRRHKNGAKVGRGGAVKFYSFSENTVEGALMKPSGLMIARPEAPLEAPSREGYDTIKENEFKSAQKEPLSTLSIDVDTAAYANIRRFLNMSRLPPADAVRIEELINYFSYDYPNPKEQPFSINTEISAAPWAPEHRLIHVGLQGKKIDLQALPPSNLVYLLDVSGSMRRANKLPLLKAAFKLLVKNMRVQDRVAIVVYAGAAGLVLPSTPGKQQEKILAALDGLRAGGSTAGGAGIKLAYKVAQDNFIKGGNNRIILATDGDFNVGQSSDGELVRLIEEKRKSGVFLSILGFGMGNYQDAKMQKLAQHGNGNHAYIDSILEAKKVLVKEMGGTLFTIAKDVKIQIEFNPNRVKAYRLIGYENRILAAKDFNDDKKDAGELGAGHTVTALYEIIPAGSKEQISGIDELKYQKSTLSPAAGSQEMMTLKLRYKAPDDDKSKLISQPILDQQIKETSDNFRFSAAVAMFGMSLRDSKFKGSSSWAKIKQLGEGAKGKDLEGYRAEFVQLVKKAELLKQLK